MDFSILTNIWCDLSPEARVIIVTDSDRLFLAQEIQKDISNECCVINIEDRSNYMDELKSLTPSDLVVAIFSFDTFVQNGANKVFSPFGKPEGVKAKYVFIRLGISRESFLHGLSTPAQLVYDTIERLHSFKDGSRLSVTNPTGTDITLAIKAFGTCEHRITKDGEMAFLPPFSTNSTFPPY